MTSNQCPIQAKSLPKPLEVGEIMAQNLLRAIILHTFGVQVGSRGLQSELTVFYPKVSHVLRPSGAKLAQTMDASTRRSHIQAWFL